MAQRSAERGRQLAGASGQLFEKRAVQLVAAAEGEELGRGSKLPELLDGGRQLRWGNVLVFSADDQRER